MKNLFRVANFVLSKLLSSMGNSLRRLKAHGLIETEALFFKLANCMIILALVSISFASCANTSNVNIKLEFDSDGQYTGFKSIPDGYTMAQAIEDGCYVSKDLEEIGGGEAWESFIKDSEAGKDSGIRVVSIFDEGIFYTDLFYAKGYYHIFDSSAEDLKDNQYKYMLDLSGRMPQASRDSRFVVLTNEKELTFENVVLKMISSSMEAINSIPEFKIIPGVAY